MVGEWPCRPGRGLGVRGFTAPRRSMFRARHRPFTQNKFGRTLAQSKMAFILPFSSLLCPWLLAILRSMGHCITNSMDSFRKVTLNETPTQTNGLTVWDGCVCVLVGRGGVERGGRELKSCEISWEDLYTWTHFSSMFCSTHRGPGIAVHSPLWTPRESQKYGRSGERQSSC